MASQRLRGGTNGSGPESARNASGFAAMTRAEKFEGEKKRIIESCFGKKDQDGAYAESYITHLCIVEDATSPSAPPSPDAPQESKKPRVIIVAVRRSGRVRMHKARENSNTTYSIGKSWVLDDLTAIESYSGSNPTTYEEQQRKDWAGDAGFLVTIQKPYYWQAATAMEKTFFIGSLIKIFKKYTGGRLPQLTGFTSEELDEFAGQGQRPRTPNTQASPPRPSPGLAAIGRPSPATPSQSRDAASGLARDSPRGFGRELRYDSPSDSTSRIPESQEIKGGQSSVSEPQASSRALETKPRLALPADSPLATEKPRNGITSPRDDRVLRTADVASNEDSFQTLQGSEDRALSSSIASGERLRSNGTYSPLTRTDTPPMPGPRSQGRGLPSSVRSGTPVLDTKQDQIPERRRPPLASGNANPDPKAAASQEISTPNEIPLRDREAKSGRNALDELIGSETKQEDYFSKSAKPPTLALTKETNIREPSDAVNSSKPSERENPMPPNPVVYNIASTNPTSPFLVESPTSTASQPNTPSAPEEPHRPGLGPMIKKKSTKEIASAFRRAAQVHNAFKPRAGGAAEKWKEEALKSPNIPDGINGVFPAPSPLRDVMKSPLPSINGPSPPEPNMAGLQASTSVPDVKVTPSPAVVSQVPQETANLTQQLTPSPEKKKGVASNNQDERRKKRPSNHSAKYAKALRIEASLLEGRTLEIESTLTDFGWGEGDTVKKSIDDLQTDIRRDLAKLETGSWLGNDDHNDERVAAVGKMLDRAIAECEELDGLLTLYNVELGTLSEDVAYIEAQSQGLQVQTANQRLLHTELQGLLETITISSSQLLALKDASLTKPQGISDVETALSQLYKAMLTIDPKLRQNGDRPASADGLLKVDPTNGVDKIGYEISTMRAVQEKKAGYRRESIEFIQRFKNHMLGKFRDTESFVTDSINRSTGLPMNNSKLDLRRRDQVRGGMWMYSPLMLFARDIDSNEWEELLRMYESTAKKPYQEEFRENVSAWKRVVRSSAGEEQDTSFTTQEKESDSLVARTLTVKRSKTFREGPRVTSTDKSQDGKISGCEAFAGALYDMSQAIFLEQNFVVDLFHLSSLETAEFPDAVTAKTPESRQGGDLHERKLFDPNRTMARRLQRIMDDMYSFWPAEMQNLVEWVVKQDALQGVGVLFALESKLSDLEETNQEFLTLALTQIHSRLTARFDRLVEEQIRGIEDTKVKMKKRRGVIAFIKTFPYFSSKIESMLPYPRADSYEVRHMVNDVYIKINKAMFESLRFIAKESPVVLAGQKAQGPTGGEAEDKEVLNYHILLIENMYHYTEEVETRNNPILEEWRDRATNELNEHMDLYLTAVIRRPLGKLLDFLESTESLMANAANGPATIAARASHSRSTFKKVLSTFDAREIRKGIESLRKRVDKHFGELEDPSVNRKNIVKMVLRQCEERYKNVYDRAARIIAEVYEGGLDIEFRKEDISLMFPK